MSKKLDTGDIFPPLMLNLAGGGTMAIPDEPDATYRVILFYRGHW